MYIYIYIYIYTYIQTGFARVIVIPLCRYMRKRFLRIAINHGYK